MKLANILITIGWFGIFLMFAEDRFNLLGALCFSISFECGVLSHLLNWSKI